MPTADEMNEDATQHRPSGEGDHQHPAGHGPGGGTGGTTAGGGGAVQRIIGHMMSNKIEAALWLSRLFTVFSTINFLLPIFGGNPQSSYQKVLLSNAVTSALRLHQRVPNFQFSRVFFGQLLLEDSAHYLFFSLIFITGPPVSMTMVPVFLYAVLHAQSYTKQLLNQIGPNSIQFLRGLMAKIEAQQVNILRFIACNEIFLMPSLVFLLFFGQSNIIMPFMYYRFLALRYSSRRNPYCRQLFSELRYAAENLIARPACPQMVRNIAYKAINLLVRLAPAVNQ